ncbi:MAG: sigma 54-interacting transcriptional regulator [Myxococcota bacterium]
MVCLSPSDRSFFREAAELVVSNPFGAAREAADRALAEAPTTVVDHDDVVDRVLDRLNERLDALGPGDLRRHPEDEREWLQLVRLFCLFHELAPELDRDIDAQLAGRPRRRLVAVGEARDQLLAHGFAASEADRYLGIVWQARRAYCFIGRQLIGLGPSMRRLRESLWNSVFTFDLLRYARHLHARMEDFSTFIVGETGAGKTAAAAAIGRAGFIPYDASEGDFSAPFADCFLATNLSAIPATLVESELFGHVKGAFTGALTPHQGLFARSPAHGAVFLDEIGEVSPLVQVKLLRVLQDRHFAPVGSHEEARFAGRVIAATNRTLEEMATTGRLRPDLFYRLSSDVIEVPPLRQRFSEAPEELPQMVEALLVRMVGGAAADQLDPVVAAIDRDVPIGYAWPGNVRELEQCVRRVLLRGDATPTGWPDGRPRPDASEPPGSLRSSPPPAGGEAGAHPDRRLLLQLTEGATWPLDTLSAAYCRLVHAETGSYEAAARRLAIDWRTVKRYVAMPTSAGSAVAPGASPDSS